MANLRGRTIRTGFGARALAFKNHSMKSIAAAGAVLALATTGTVVVQTQTAPAAVAEETANKPAAQANQIIDADMIASGRVTKASNLTDSFGVGKGLISGHVYLTSPNGNPGAAYDNGNKKLDGITVYAQFRDKDGSYSPIFSAKTHTLPDVVGGNGGQGTFAFGTGKKGITWTDQQGREHTWSALYSQKHRIWVEPFTNDRGNRVEMFRQANGWTPGSFNRTVDGPMGSFTSAGGNMQLMAAFLREVPPNHEKSYMAAKGDKLVEDPKGPISSAATQLGESNVLSGQVWLETGGSPDWGFPATGPKRDSVTQDPAADGYTVYASTLTKDGAAANKALQEKFKNDPDKLAEETKKMLEAHPEYILKTVYGKTDKEGNYSLRFGGYTDKNQTREDFLNPDHVFVWVENKDGVVQTGYTGFHTPIFQRFDAGGNFKPADAVPAENQAVTSRIEDLGKPRYGKPVNSIYNVRHALMPYTPVSITADYNATDKPAKPGTKVTPEFSGELSALPSKIEWRDKNGTVVKTCELDQSKAAKAQVAACTFDIPANAQKGDVYNVVVVSGGNDVAAWSVLVTDKKAPNQNADFDPKYEDKLVVPGKETKSSPTFKDKDGKDAKAPEGSKFKITDGFTAPEGYTVKIDESTGEITVTADPEKLNKDTKEEFDVPVTVTYPDESTDEVKANFKLDTDGDGTPDTTDEDDDNDSIPDEVEKDKGSNPKDKGSIPATPIEPGNPTNAATFEPGYEDGSGKPGTDVTVPAPTFKDKDGKDTTAPEGTKFTPGDNAPEGVTIDENTGEITVKVPEDAKPGDKITVPVVVTYPDGTKDTVDVTVTVTDKDNGVYAPAYEDKLVVPGKETKSSPTFKDKDGKDAKAPEGSKFKITDGFTAPEGYTVKIDESTGEITVTADPEKLNKDTKEEFDVPVTVTYPDESTDEVKANFKLDTDGDGTPDTTDEDDDNDSIPDEVEKDKGSNPKDKGSIPATPIEPGKPTNAATFEPGYEDGSGKPGSDVKIDAPKFKDKDGKDTKAPEGTKFTPGDNAPEGVTIDENTGEITVKVPEDAKPGDKITVPVVVTYPDGTKDTVDVTVTVTDKDNGVYAPAYEDKLVVPGKETKSSPTFKDKDGKDAKAPEGSKFKITDGFTAPEGYTVKIDESTGEITVTADPEKLNKDTKEEFDVPVTVTYPDESTDEVKANFKLDTDGDGTPDTTDEDDDNDSIPDEVEKDKGSNPKDKGSIPATPIEPGNPTNAATFEPGYEDGSGKPGTDVTVPAPTFKDKDGKDTKAPEGTKFTPGDNAPEGVTIDENTGEITVKVPEDAKPGDKITVPVVVTYPDGTKDTVDVTVTVEQPDVPEEPAKDNEKYEPEYNNGTGQPGEDVTIDVPTFKDGDNNKIDVPSGTNFTPGAGTPDGVTVNPDGSIKVTIPETANPGDKITVPVVVTYPDGTQDNVEVTVTVTEKDATPVTPVAPTEHNPSLGASAGDPASCELPPFVTVEKTEGVEYKVTVDGKELTPDAEGKYVYEYGQTVKVEATPAEGYTFPEGAQTTWTYTTQQNEVCEAPAEKPDWKDDSGKPGDKVEIPNTGGDVPAGTTVETDGPGKAEIDENGNLIVDIDKDAKPGDKIEVIVKDKDGKEIDRVDVEVEQPDTPAEKPDWKDDSGKPDDKVEIPNTGGDVPAGTTVETDGPGKAEIDENGNLIVDIDKDAKPGDKIEVIVKDKDGKEIDRVDVEVEQPDTPAEKPDWKDDSGKPGDKVEIPNTGGDVPAGTTVETEGPGKAEIDENGKLIVDIDKDAKPGDKITVIVKDKDGKVIDEVTVTVTEKDDQPGGPVGSVKDPNKIGAIIGGTIVGSGLIGALLGNHGDGAGSSAPGKPGEAKPGKPGAEKPGKPGKPGKGADKGAKPGKAGDQGAGKGADNGAAGNQSAGKGSTGATSQSTEAGSRGGSLAVTGVSGLAITLGASVIALALGGALMALRRRQS